MDKAALAKKVADMLGVSGSERDLAFSILVEKISEILSRDEALKVPDLGYFQIKHKPEKFVEKIIEADLGAESYDTLLFSPIEGIDALDTSLMFLTFDIPSVSAQKGMVDENVFDIGFGKPILPLADDSNHNDSDTSYVLLKKSIEERVLELLSNCDKLENYDLWEDYLNSISEKPEVPQKDSSVLEVLGEDEIKFEEKEILVFEEEEESNIPVNDEINEDAELPEESIEPDESLEIIEEENSEESGIDNKGEEKAEESPDETTDVTGSADDIFVPYPDEPENTGDSEDSTVIDKSDDIKADEVVKKPDDSKVLYDFEDLKDSENSEVPNLTENSEDFMEFNDPTEAKDSINLGIIDDAMESKDLAKPDDSKVLYDFEDLKDLKDHEISEEPTLAGFNEDSKEFKDSAQPNESNIFDDVDYIKNAEDPNTLEDSEDTMETDNLEKSDDSKSVDDFEDMKDIENLESSEDLNVLNYLEDTDNLADREELKDSGDHDTHEDSEDIMETDNLEKSDDSKSIDDSEDLKEVENLESSEDLNVLDYLEDTDNLADREELKDSGDHDTFNDPDDITDSDDSKDVHEFEDLKAPINFEEPDMNDDSKEFTELDDFIHHDKTEDVKDSDSEELNLLDYLEDFDDSVEPENPVDLKVPEDTNDMVESDDFKKTDDSKILDDSEDLDILKFLEDDEDSEVLEESDVPEFLNETNESVGIDDSNKLKERKSFIRLDDSENIEDSDELEKSTEYNVLEYLEATNDFNDPEDSDEEYKFEDLSVMKDELINSDVESEADRNLFNASNFFDEEELEEKEIVSRDELEIEGRIKFKEEKSTPDDDVEEFVFTTGEDNLQTSSEDYMSDEEKNNNDLEWDFEELSDDEDTESELSEEPVEDADIFRKLEESMADENDSDQVPIIEKASIDIDPDTLFEETNHDETNEVSNLKAEDNTGIKLDLSSDVDKPSVNKNTDETSQSVWEKLGRTKIIGGAVAATIVIVFVAVYFFSGNSAPVDNATAGEQVMLDSTTQADSNAVVTMSGESPTVTEPVKEQPAASDVKSNKQSDALIKEFPNEQSAGNLIFYNGKDYYVQVSSHSTMEKAEKEVKRLRAMGHNAFIMKAWIKKFNSYWYRVKIGFFKSLTEAKNFQRNNKF